jgi:putative ABC transport system permease protein
MWAHYFVTLYRFLTRHRLYAALNVLGLAVGIAVFLVLTLFVRFQSSFDDFIPDAHSIYLVRQSWTLPGLPTEADNTTMGGLLEELQTDFPQLQGVRLKRNSVIVRQGPASSADFATFVDPSFFDVFDLPLAEGTRIDSLRDPTSLIVTQSTAQKYFGQVSPIGHVLTLSVDGVAHIYHIVGVLKDLPANTHLKIEMLARLMPAWFDTPDAPYFYHWGSSSLETYLKIADPAQARAVDAGFDAFVDRYGAKDMGRSPAPHTRTQLRLAPLRSLHLIEPTDATTVVTLGIVGLLTLLIAALNYVNLATAQAGLRAREVALRKVMGATRLALMLQFLAETVAATGLAGLSGLALTELALPAVNAAGGTSLALHFFGADSVLVPLVGVVLVIGLGAGLYPALILSRFGPAAVLASARTPGGGRMGARVREGLVVAQFAIAIAFIVCTTVLLSQTRYIQTASLGFRRDGIILVKSFGDSELSDSQRSALMDIFRGLPGITSATQSDTAPGQDSNNNSDTMTRPGLPGPPPSITWTNTGPDYFVTYGAKLLAGRWMDRFHGMDDSSRLAPAARDVQGGSVVLNVQAIKRFGFPNPSSALGQRIQEETNRGTMRNYTVVGVVQDLRFHSPREQIRPMIYFFNTGAMDRPIAAVRFTGADPRLVMDRVKAAWTHIAPSVPFEGRTAEDNLSDYYRPDQQRSRLFSMGAVLAVVIGCIGLYGLASFNTALRVREIGIRKALGASAADILRLLVMQFLKPVAVANFVAWPLAYLAMRSWLDSFDQRISLSPLYFIAATLLTLTVALATIIGQALVVARAEPAKALRHE